MSLLSDYTSPNMQSSFDLSLIAITIFSCYLRTIVKAKHFNFNRKMQLLVPVQSFNKKEIKLNENYQKSNQKVVEKSENFFISTWKSFTKHTSIHAVHYLTESSINVMERIIWALAIVVASAATVYSCILLSNRFRTSLISTVFESTNFKVSEIPFAAVSLCNNNRFDYNKTDDVFNKFQPNGSKTAKETFVKFLHVFQNLEWGSYDEFEVLQGDNVTELTKINTVQLYEFMMHNCEDFFMSCWWKNKPFKCCDWFSRQRTEYGICWSFNSFLNVGSKFINVSLCFTICELI